MINDYQRKGKMNRKEIHPDKLTDDEQMVLFQESLEQLKTENVQLRKFRTKSLPLLEAYEKLLIEIGGDGPAVKLERGMLKELRQSVPPTTS
jgi:hypothetical protein